MEAPKTPAPSTAVERSLNRQVVLEEDEYTAALSHIIARDFFPSLVHLDATNNYLDAVHSRDPHLINASVRRLEEISSTPMTQRRMWQTPSQTPYGGGPSDTPLRTPRSDAGGSAGPRYDASLPLDAFQARYTSEDNSSFTQILDEENRKRKERWAWAWDAQKRVEGMRERILEGRERMLVEAPAGAGVREKFVIEAPVPAGLITDAKEGDAAEDGKPESDARKQVMQGADQSKDVSAKEKDMAMEVDVMAPKKDTRSAGVDGWKFKARNSLMFSPDADVSPYHPPMASRNLSSDPKSITHNSTRMVQDDYSSSTSRSISAPPSPTRSRIDAAISGTPYRPRSPTSNGFPLVPTLPSPTPSELGPAAVKQLMTWGTLTATPRILGSDDDPALPTPSTPFHLPAPSARERISQRLSNSASRSLRAKAGLLGIGTPRTPGGVRKGSMLPPAWTPRRADAPGSLTPAARRLLDRSTMGTAAARRAEAMVRTAGWEGTQNREKDLNRVRWTPSPSPAPHRG